MHTIKAPETKRENGTEASPSINFYRKVQNRDLVRMKFKQGPQDHNTAGNGKFKLKIEIKRARRSVGKQCGETGESIEFPSTRLG